MKIQGDLSLQIDTLSRDIFTSRLLASGDLAPYLKICAIWRIFSSLLIINQGIELFENKLQIVTNPLTGSLTALTASLPFARRVRLTRIVSPFRSGGFVVLEAPDSKLKRMRFRVALPLRLIRTNSTLPLFARQSLRPPAAKIACTNGVLA